VCGVRTAWSYSSCGIISTVGSHTDDAAKTYKNKFFRGRIIYGCLWGEYKTPNFLTHAERFHYILYYLKGVLP
jgi:hypothetical protein